MLLPLLCCCGTRAAALRLAVGSVGTPPMLPRRTLLSWLSAGPAAFALADDSGAAVPPAAGGGGGGDGDGGGVPWRLSDAEVAAAQAAGAEPDNIFLRILRGDAPAVAVDDDREAGLFTFRDRNPASTIHLLVIPRRFVRDASMLGANDAELVRQMTSKAIALVRSEVEAKQGRFDESQLSLGFHYPPWYSVPWLHLHAIYPKRVMGRRYKYTAFSFYTPERILRALR